jgi:hypothetical protein
MQDNETYRQSLEALAFRTVGQGYLGPSVDPGRKQGAALCAIGTARGGNVESTDGWVSHDGTPRPTSVAQDWRAPGGLPIGLEADPLCGSPARPRGETITQTATLAIAT